MVNFWFAPVVMALMAMLLAWGLYWLNTRIPNKSAGTAGNLWLDS